MFIKTSYHCRQYRRGFKPGNECVYLHLKENDCPVENEIDKNVDISENENDEVINNDGYLYNNEEVSKQNQPSDESN